MADDVVNFTSMLKLSYNFLAGRDQLKKLKFREKKKLVSVVLPFSDLAFAAGAVPVFPIRMEMFDVDDYLKSFGSVTNIFGWTSVTNVLGFVKKLGLDGFNKAVEQISDKVINSINKKYNEVYELGLEHGISSDFCYGLKALYGMHVSKGKNVDAILNFTIRCSAYNKLLEALKLIVPKQIWVETPSRNLPGSLDITATNVANAIKELELLTGNTVTDNSLRKQFRLRNQIAQLYKTIIYEISASDFYPCNPATFAEILSLLSISFQDYNSNVVQYLENLDQLVKEMRARIKKGIGMDVSKMKRIMFTPMFGGWEPSSHEVLYSLGARTIYADWDVLGFLEEIKVTNNSDPIRGYAEFLLNMSTKGFGCDNETMVNSYVKVAKKLKVDGIIFNQLYGCHSISNCYTMLKDKLRRDYEVPTTMLNFNKIGENVEQTKTRLTAFMEMF